MHPSTDAEVGEMLVVWLLFSQLADVLVGSEQIGESTGLVSIDRS